MPDFHHHTYLACLSRHLGGAEDHLGRLSMWRAYGGGVAGVAIVLNGSSFSRPLAALKATASPVAYLSEHGFLAEFDRVTQALETHRDYLIGLGRERVKDYIFAVFRFAVLCTKHPGFKEELEWRVVYQPSLDPSDHIVRCTETINGVPQPIYKMRLQDVPEAGLVGIEIKDLIERVIVGPTRYPDAVCEAFVDALEAAGVPDAKQKVVPSTIPLRQ
jgi:Protein of unknown function (DUF2971)